MAWGDEGHEIIALIAQAYLTPTAARQVNALLAADRPTSQPMISPTKRPAPTNIVKWISRVPARRRANGILPTLRSARRTSYQHPALPNGKMPIAFQSASTVRPASLRKMLLGSRRLFRSCCHDDSPVPIPVEAWDRLTSQIRCVPTLAIRPFSFPRLSQTQAV
jgi:hypothetical protein